MKKIKIIALSTMGLFLFAFTGFASSGGTIDAGLGVGAGDAQTAVEPVASPVAGTYTSTRSVTLTATGASSIRYTTDGSTPTCSVGTVYSGAISVSSSKTIKAISCYIEGDGSVSHSLVSSFAYTIRSGGGGGGGGGSSSAAEPEDFTTQSDCENADFYWYNGVCNLNPAPVVEDEDDEDLTETAERERERVRDLEEQLDGIEKNRGNMQTLRERAVMLLGIVQAKGEGYESAEQALLALIERIDAMEGRLSEELGEVEEELNKAKESASNYNQLERLETMRRNATTLINALTNQEGRETQRTAIQTLLNAIEALKTRLQSQLQN